MLELSGFSLDLSALGEKNRPDPQVTYDVVVVGGGPAAMTAALYAARKLIKVAVLTRDFGGQMTDTSEIENFIGFQSITGKELTQKFREHMEQFRVPVLQGEKVSRIAKEEDLFRLQLESGTPFTARTVVVATGKRPRPLNVPGEKELTGRGVAYCATCDAPFFKDKDVVVAGGGNSAFTAAADLLKVARRVTVVNFVEGWQADGVLQESVSRSGDRVRLLDYHEIILVEGGERVTAVKVKNRTNDGVEQIPADGVFVEIGLLPNTEPVKGLAELNRFNELVVDCHCRTSVPGLFGAGDVTTVPYKQIVVSAGEGAKAALSAHEYLLGRGFL